MGILASVRFSSQPDETLRGKRRSSYGIKKDKKVVGKTCPRWRPACLNYLLDNSGKFTSDNMLGSLAICFACLSFGNGQMGKTIT